jgi:hypothetical protein
MNMVPRDFSHLRRSPFHTVMRIFLHHRHRIDRHQHARNVGAA